MTTIIMPTCPKCDHELPSGMPHDVCPRCLFDDEGDASQLEASDVPTAAALGRIQHFRLLEELGRGGMGVVYKAYQEDLKRTVALKMIRGGRFADTRELERFQAEAEAAATLRHPGIVAIHEVGEEEGNHYYSMELVEGGDLESWQKGQPVAPRKAAKLMKQIAQAVAYAHEQGIIHRDLKPQNVLLDKEERPHITDFGIAKRLDNEAQLTVTGTIMGSPSFMSPEQANGQTSAIRETTDVYSLGALLYALLVGRPPFQAATAVKTLEQVTSREPLPPKAIDPSLPEDLNTLCLQCLQKSPQARYASAQALVEDLDRFLEGKPIVARPIGRTETALKWVRRNPTVSALSGAILAVALIGFGSVWWQWRQTEAALATAEDARRAEISAHAPQHSPTLTLENHSSTLSVAFAPNGIDLLTASADGYWRLFDGTTGKVRQAVDGHEGMVAQASFYHSGTRLLSYSFDPQTHYPHLNPNGENVSSYTSHDYGDQTAKVWDAASGAVLLSLSRPVQMSSAVLSPDERWIATADWDGVVTIYEAKSGEEQGRHQAHRGAVAGLHFSPDSTKLVTSSEGMIYEMEMTPHSRSGSSTSSNESHIAHVLEVPSARPLYSLPNQAHNGLLGLRILGSHSTSRATARFSPDGRWIATTGANPDNTALWDAVTGKRHTQLKGHSHSVFMAAFSPDSRLLASAGADHTVRLWDTAKGKPIHTLDGHEGPILWTEFSPDGRLLVSASGDGTARVWDAQQGICVARLKGHADRVYRAHFSPDGLRVATASQDGTARLWDAASLDFLSQTHRHENEVIGMTFSEDSQRVITRTRRGMTVQWNTGSEGTPRIYRALPELADEALRQRFVDDTLYASLTPDGSRLVTLTEEEMAVIDKKPFFGFIGGLSLSPAFTPLRLWDTASGNVIAGFPANHQNIGQANLSPDGKWLAGGQKARHTRTRIHRSWAKSGTSGSSQHHEGPTSVWVWDTSDGRLLHELPDHEGDVTLVAFAKDSQHLLSADRQQARLWSMETGMALATFEEASYADSATFLPDGKHVLLHTPGRTGIWRLSDGELLTRFEIEGRLPDIRHVALSPSAEWAACSTHTHDVYLCDTRTGQVAQKLEGHQSNITSLAIHPSGKWLASASKDKTVRVWDVETGRTQRLLEAHKDEVNAVAFSGDGQWLGSASDDFTARLWPVKAF